MEYRNLGRTGLKVSELCMGTMTFGWTASEEDSFAILDAYVESGGNFLDTANIYSKGVSEEIIGRWLAARGNRHEIVIATKVRGKMSESPNDVGLSRKHILDSVEASLERLQVEYIDLYQAHSDDGSVRLEETLEAFDVLVQRGDVRYIGASNYTAWRLMKAIGISDANGLARYDSLQPNYSLAKRSEFESELEPLCLEEGVGVIPYSPLAGGFLTGKYRRDTALPDSARAENVRKRYMHEEGFTLLDRIDAVAKRHDATPAQVSLAWLLARPSMTSPIIGANSPDQWRELSAATDITLGAEDIAALDEASSWA